MNNAPKTDPALDALYADLPRPVKDAYQALVRSCRPMSASSPEVQQRRAEDLQDEAMHYNVPIKTVCDLLAGAAEAWEAGR
ncbi:MAG: hypothetical protein GY884_16450 [Proteobacteria bacterium]|nr:hypothetical protein [Pseudomonadota bacterium]